MEIFDPRARPFSLKGKGECVLLVHGFTGTAAEMHPLGERITKEFGWQTKGVLLPGHGTSLEDLTHFKMKDWLACVETTRDELLAFYPQVHLVGMSMGATLCLLSFLRYPHRVASMILLAPAVWLRTPLQNFLARTLPALPIPLCLDRVKKSKPLAPDHVAYDHYSIRGTGEFMKICDALKDLRPMQTPPTLIISSLDDDVIHPKSARFLSERLLNPKSKLIELPHSYHVVTIGEERERVFSECLQFYRSL